MSVGALELPRIIGRITRKIISFSRAVLERRNLTFESNGKIYPKILCDWEFHGYWVKEGKFHAEQGLSSG